MMTLRTAAKACKQKAFSLVEMTLALILAMILASASLVLLSDHVNLLRIINSFDFLRDDAPTINMLMVKMLNRADSYRVYASKATAFSESSAITTGGRCVRLIYRNPDGSSSERIIAFEVVNGEGQLNFYSKGAIWSNDPDWTISSKVSDVTFSNDTGILLVKITGPNQEEITYVGGGE